MGDLSDDRSFTAIVEPDWPTDDPGPPPEPRDHSPDVGRMVDLPEGRDLYVDVAALLDGELPEPPKPMLLRRTDGHAMLYPARVNALFGDPENGKTWVAIAACVEGLRDGRRVLFMDLDHNGAESVIANLLMLGAPRVALCNRDLFRYCDPDEPGEVYRVVDDGRIWRPAIAVIDSLGELLPLMGAKSNDGDEYTIANSRVMQPLANAGAAVLVIDHLAKNLNSRAAGPSGTGAKRRALGGTSIRVKSGRQFVPGKGGSALLIVNKDRHGGVRRNCPSGEREPLAGTFVMDEPNWDGTVDWRVIPPLELTSASFDDKAAEFLSAVRELEGEFTAKDAAAALFGEAAPTASQTKQAAHHLDRLATAGVLDQVAKGRRGAGASKWRLSETAGQGNPTNPMTMPFSDEPSDERAGQGVDANPTQIPRPISEANPMPNPMKSDES